MPLSEKDELSDVQRLVYDLKSTVIYGCTDQFMKSSQDTTTPATQPESQKVEVLSL